MNDKPPPLAQHIQRRNDKARKQHESDIERKRINAIGKVAFDPPVRQVRNSSMPNGYRTPIWNIRECNNKMIKSIGK